jgi:hypothetical protein
MTRSPSPLDQAFEESPFDFVAYLASRVGLEEKGARETLGRWMANYEPMRSSNASRASRPYPASGAFPRSGAEEAGRGEEVSVA